MLLTGAPAIGAPVYDWHLPRGFPIPAVPTDNPMSDSKVALGQRLFFEPRLSITGKYSCASCHEPARAFTDGKPLGIGATGQQTANNSMSLANVAYNVSYGWSKPTVHSLEDQMLEPLLNEHPIEVGLKGREPEVITLLTNDTDYRTRFAEAFPDSNGVITFNLIVKAIAAFERTLISGRSPFDLYVFGGQHEALTDEAKRGMSLFYSERLGCSACHSGFNFAGNWRDAQGATGEPSFATNGTGDVAVRVPTLRNIAVTAPYMHNGSLSTLEAVVAHYESAGQRATGAINEQPKAKTSDKPGDSPRPEIRAFTLSAAERGELVAFLRSLTDQQFLAGFDEQGTNPLPGR